LSSSFNSRGRRRLRPSFRRSPLHPGHAYVADVDLRHAGIWQVDVRLDGEEEPGVSVTFQFYLL